jgi:hypothetical protein
MQIHLHQYRSLLSRDAYGDLAASAESVSFEGRTAKERLSEAVEGVVEAIQKANEPSYWAALERHQNLLFRLHRILADRVFRPQTSDPFMAFDFIQACGWRRFRFSERIIHFLRRSDDGETLVSVLPNYRPENLEKLKAFAHTQEQHAVFDALEMESLLQPGRESFAPRAICEKARAKQRFRLLPSESWEGTGFVNLPLEKANSAALVTDWTLPLRG